MRGNCQVTGSRATLLATVSTLLFRFIISVLFDDPYIESLPLFPEAELWPQVVSPNPSSCTQGTVMLYKPKCSSSEQRKLYCEGQAGSTGALCLKDLNSQMDFRGKFLKAK